MSKTLKFYTTRFRQKIKIICFFFLNKSFNLVQKSKFTAKKKLMSDSTMPIKIDGHTN